jgi:nicotinate phosphoribosyltransferase
MQPAVFELFVRKLPERRGFLVVAGLEQARSGVFALFSDDLSWLKSTGRFLDALADFLFTGEVHAKAEGTICFENEPIVRVIAPL